MTDSAGTPPPPEALAALLGPAGHVVRYAEIYEEDGTTLWKSKDELGVLAGQVTVDQGRQERRTVQLELDNTDGSLQHRSGGFWYDKIIKLWRGVQWEDDDGETQEWAPQIGEFMIDEASSQNFPHTVGVTGRDYTKKLLRSKFKVPTSFARNQPVENVIKTIATNGGISPNKMILPATGQNTGKDWYFDKNVERWVAMEDIATHYGYELYFDGNGFLVMRRFRDPATSPSVFVFETGEYGSLVSYKKSARDTRLYNIISVSGESANTTPVYGLAENRSPGSPTSVDEIGERVYGYTSQFITTQEQAQAVARDFLLRHTLEEYDISLSSICLPWLEAGEIIEFYDPDAAEGDPTRFLLSNFSIPLKLGGMSSVGKRVVLIEE